MTDDEMCRWEHWAVAASALVLFVRVWEAVGLELEVRVVGKGVVGVGLLTDST